MRVSVCVCVRAQVCVFAEKVEENFAGEVQETV